jgi:hypothetical protein
MKCIIIIAAYHLVHIQFASLRIVIASSFAYGFSVVTAQAWKQDRMWFTQFTLAVPSAEVAHAFGGTLMDTSNSAPLPPVPLYTIQFWYVALH